MTQQPTPPGGSQGSYGPHPNEPRPSNSGPRVTREQMRDLSSLRRSRDNRMIAGVAEGIARHLDVDVILIRVLFGALTIFGGAGVLLYAIGWIAMPVEGESDSPLSRALRRDPSRVLYGAVLVAAAIGAITVFSSIGFVTPHPAPVIGVGLIMVIAVAYLARRNDRELPPPSVVAGPDAPPAAETVAFDDPGTATAGATGTTGTIPVSDEFRDVDGASNPPTTYYPPARSYPPSPRRKRSHLFAITMAIVAIALGGLWIADATGSEIAPDVYPGTALAIIAAALIVGAWYGRSRLLIFAGIVATLATTATAAVGPGAIGQRVYAPTTAASLDSSYRMAAGQLVLKLGSLSDPADLDGRTVSMHSRIGQLLVIVPTSVDVSITAQAGHGDIRGLAGTEEDGEGERVTGPTGPHALYLDLDVDYGEIVVKRIDCPTVGDDPTPAQVSATTLSQITMTTSGGTNVAACN